MIRLKKITAVCAMLAFYVAMLFPDPAFGLSIKKEKEAAQEFKSMVFRYMDVIEDTLIADYIDTLGNKIMSHLPQQPFEFEFYVINEDSYNAFAGPGGIIGIHSGLFAAMDHEDELAGILCHEIAHGVHRHMAKRAGQSMKIGLATLAAVAAGILVGSMGGGIPTEALAIGALSAGQSVALSYSREAETQADKSGIAYMKKAGYSSEGLLSILRKMREQQWFGPQEMPTYLTTHPALEERYSYIGAQTDIKASPSRSTILDTESDFNWAHTKLVALYGEEESALRRFESDVKNHPESILAHYGYGLALARTDRYEKAVDHMRSALGKAVFNPHILIDLGRIYFKSGQLKDAAKTLKSAVALSPDNVEGLYFYGRSQLETGEYEDAANAFSTVVDKNNDIMRAYYYLGEAHGKLGHAYKAHYNLAIYYKRIGNFKNAIYHLEKAAKAAESDDEKEEIDGIMESVKKERRDVGGA